MKIPLRYQMTEYDCGPTSLLNGLSLLFEREELAPALIRSVMLYSLDSFGADGTTGKNGTSHAAMAFLSAWLDNYGKTGLLDVRSRYLSGREVHLGQESLLRSALMRGGAAVVRLDLEGWHYVLMTGIREDDTVLLFDPYLTDEPFADGEIRVTDVPGRPWNREIPAHVFEREELRPYAFGPAETREALLLFNGGAMLTEENTVEYYI